MQHLNRRHMLSTAGSGLGAAALTWMTNQAATAAPSTSDNPLAAKDPHHPPRAKSVIWCFMEGGPSQMDTFDPKPLLNELSGKPLPESFGTIITPMGESNAPLLGSKRKWARHGESGLWVSDWLPHIAECVDDIAVLRSCQTDGINHAGGVCEMNTGTPLAGRPSLGSWVTYGLGTENTNLPAFVVMQDKPTQIVNGPRNWGPGFMPALYQGTPFSPTGAPIANLNPPGEITPDRQRGKLDLLSYLNGRHAEDRAWQTELDARIKSYELAYRMQATAPEAVDLASESKETQSLYGLDDEQCAPYGKTLLLARRLVERGVRFVQCYHGAGSKWDSHSNIEGNHAKVCRQSDKPVAGLLKDLKQRGLLEDTLVVWGGEFGRTPMSEKGNGRDHNVHGFTIWMAGGGVKGGRVIGKTDDLGLRAVEDKLHVHDVHATILHLLGLGHMDLVYQYKGRPERPTLNEGEPYEKIVG